MVEEKKIHLQKHALEVDMAITNKLSYLEMLVFLKAGAKTVYIAGFVGLIVAILYLLISPAYYQAIVSISVARIITPNNSLGAMFEEPAALIARMSNPTNLGPKVINVCSFDAADDVRDQLNKYVKLSVSKSVPFVVDIKVIRPTQELTKVCADEVYHFFVKSQNEMLESFTQSAKAKSSADLAKIEKRLSEDRLLVIKDQARGLLTPTYFALLNQVRALEDQRDTLLAALEFQDAQGALLYAPINVSNKPVYPKTIVILLVGFLGGIFLGLCIALGCKGFKTLKAA